MNKFHNILKLNKLSIFLIITIINYNLTLNTCPINCKCDLYNDKNRADCSGLKLIYPSINMPNNVEIFNLSNNSISTLENESFKGLSNIIEIILHHNSIHQIDLNAFNDLKLLIYLDLSNNRLEYFDERILENNLKLKELNLSGNKFMLLENNPLIISKSLEILNLNKSQLTHIFPKIFELLPSIKYIDLSENLFIILNTKPFVQLTKLRYLDLDKNRLKCDLNTKISLKYFYRNNITYNINDCKLRPEDLLTENNILRGSKKMFERMMIAPSTEVKNQNEITEEQYDSPNDGANETNNWKNLEKTFMERCVISDQQSICKSFLNSMKECNKTEVNSKDRKLFFFLNDLYMDFFFGLFMGGLTMSCLLGSIMICIFSCKFTAKNSVKDQPNEQHVMDILSELEMQNNESPLPPRTRRVRRRVPPIDRVLSPATRHTSISTQSDFATFLSNLFDRPQRRNRYYRTLSENTARAIRRLSQSNLFNNRVSQQLVNEIRNNSSNTQQNENNSNVCQSTQPLLSSNPTAPSFDHESNINNEINLRPETPPPPYGELILVKK